MPTLVGTFLITVTPKISILPLRVKEAEKLTHDLDKTRTQSRAPINQQ